MVLLPKTAPDPGTRRQWRPRAWAGRPATWARAARGPERPQPASVRGLDSGPLGVLTENFAKESETRANLPGRDKVQRLALSSCPPRRQRELSTRGGSRTDPRGRRASPEMEAQEHLWWAAPRAHTHETPAASGVRPLRSALSHKPFPARAPRPCAPARVAQPSRQQLKRFQNGLFICSQ